MTEMDEALAQIILEIELERRRHDMVMCILEDNLASFGVSFCAEPTAEEELAEREMQDAILDEMTRFRPVTCS